MKIMGSTASVDIDSATTESNWLYLLRTHVQEWKDYYNEVNQAIQELENEHQNLRAQIAQLEVDVQLTLVAEQDRQVDELMIFYQLKRELIRERQQQQLAKL